MAHEFFTISLIPYAMLMTFLGLVSVYFIARVIHRQLGLFKIPIQAKINHFRKVLFGISLVVLAGNLFPLFIDILTIFTPVGRPPEVRLTSFVYALSVHLTLVGASFLIWKLYQLAEDVKDINDKEN